MLERPLKEGPKEDAPDFPSLLDVEPPPAADRNVSYIPFFSLPAFSPMVVLPSVGFTGGWGWPLLDTGVGCGRATCAPPIATPAAVPPAVPAAEPWVRPTPAPAPKCGPVLLITPSTMLMKARSTLVDSFADVSKYGTPAMEGVGAVRGGGGRRRYGRLRSASCPANNDGKEEAGKRGEGTARRTEFLGVDGGEFRVGTDGPRVWARPEVCLVADKRDAHAFRRVGFYVFDPGRGGRTCVEAGAREEDEVSARAVGGGGGELF